MLLHELAPGNDFHGFLVEMHSLDDVDEQTKAHDPAYMATVKDASGNAWLVYRSSNNCRPSAIKRQKTFSISGRATSHNGHVRITYSCFHLHT